MISVSNLSASVTSGKEVLSSISLEIETGSALGVYGPNGSGKSTLLRAIAGTARDRTLHGEVRVENTLIDAALSAKERVKRVLYLGSDFHTPFELKVQELFELGAHVSHQPLGKIAEVIETLQIRNFLERSFESLSDGEKQLMMFARALIQGSKLLIFDETFSKLDLDKLILVAKVLRSACAKGTTAIIASHDINFLTECADEFLFLKAGKKIAGGKVSE